jgi:sugar phosphate isomerase/epimerase
LVHDTQYEDTHLDNQKLEKNLQMKPFPIAVQLYSLRDLAKDNLKAALQAVADIGYIGVELAGLYGMPPSEVRNILDELGLVASSNHCGFLNDRNVFEAIGTARTLGYTRCIAPVINAEDCASKEAILKAADNAQNAAKLLKPAGLTCGIHNHWWEFDHKIDGQYPHEIFMEAAPDIFAQIDTYWVKVAGADPEAVVRQYGDRAPLLHIKDGPGNQEEAMLPIGSGIMDWNKVIGAAAESTEWLVVELDRCDTDMVKALADSYTYLVSNGFARGNK